MFLPLRVVNNSGTVELNNKVFAVNVCAMVSLKKHLGTIHLRRRHVLGGGGVKNLPNLPTDSTKKLPTVGG